METGELVCEKRDSASRSLLRQLRAQGRVPGVLYGPKTASMPVALDAVDLKTRLLHAGSIRLMRIKSSAAELDGKHVILKEVQRAPVSREILHADLYEVDLSRPIRVRVPLRFVGRAQGATLGGIMQPLEREVEVECPPLEIPAHVEVDISGLGIHEVLHVSALKFGANVKPIFDSDYPVATVLPPTVEAAPTPPAAEAAAAAEGAAPAEGVAAAGAPAEGAKEGAGGAQAAAPGTAKKTEAAPKK
jgi:large subunit ribosomal protein L25